MAKRNYWKSSNLPLQLAGIVLVRAVEIAILVVASLWLWSNTWPDYRQYVVASLFIAYFVYFVVTMANDYHELKYGEGDPLQ